MRQRGAGTGDPGANLIYVALHGASKADMDPAMRSASP